MEALSVREYRNNRVLWIDDENGKNANRAIIWDHNPNGLELQPEKEYQGIVPGRNTIYYIYNSL